MTTTTPDPVNNNVERVLVRNTATGMEQGVAAAAGLFTAGPLGALASWGAIRGLQGKWTPWFVIGIPATIGINIVNLVVTMGILGAIPDDTWEGIESEIDRYEQSYEYQPEEDSSSIANEQFTIEEPVNIAGNQPSQSDYVAIAANSPKQCKFMELNRAYADFNCTVNLRTNYNGDSVYDVQFGGDKAPYKVVLWDNGSAEIFNPDGIKGLGTYVRDGNNLVVRANPGQLTFVNDPSINASFIFPIN